MRNAASLVLIAHQSPLLLSEYDNTALVTRFYETVLESYLPLMELLDRSPAPITLALSQSLMEMLDQPKLRAGIDAYIEARIRTCLEVCREYVDTALEALARRDIERYQRLLKVYQERCSRDIVGTLGRWFKEDRLELIPIAGSHALLPLIDSEEVRQAHIRAALSAFKNRFGVAPGGVWLPECASSAAVMKSLARCKVGYTVVDGAQTAGRTVRIGATIAFARDGASDLLPESAPEYRMRGSQAQDTLWGWYAAGSEGSVRGLYNEEHAHEALRRSVETLVSSLEGADPDDQHAKDLSPSRVLAWSVDRLGELWFEWPTAVEELLNTHTSWVTLSALAPKTEASAMNVEEWSPGTWHAQGLAPWLGPSNHWLYRHLHRLERRMADVALGRHLDQHSGGRLPGWQMRAAQIAFRELMLAQCSDWALAMHNNAGVGHAVERAKGHIGVAGQILDQIVKNVGDRRVVEELEAEPLFSELAWLAHFTDVP